MKKIVLLATLLSVFLLAETQPAQNYNHPKVSAKPIAEKQLRKMDRELNKHKAVQRKFRTQKEFRQIHRKHKKPMPNKPMHTKHIKSSVAKHQLDYRYGYDDGGYHDDYRPIMQPGYRNFKRGWFLAYKYDKAPFYDQFGYYYGYFNRHGYYFEGIFYRYDHYYGYSDRVRGRGLFDNNYYMPANYRYYGFERPRHREGAYRY